MPHYASIDPEQRFSFLNASKQSQENIWVPNATRLDGEPNAKKPNWQSADPSEERRSTQHHEVKRDAEQKENRWDLECKEDWRAPTANKTMIGEPNKKKTDGTGE